MVWKKAMKRQAAAKRPAATKVAKQSKKETAEKIHPSKRLREKTTQEPRSGLQQSQEQKENHHDDAQEQKENHHDEAQGDLKESPKPVEQHHPEAQGGLEESQPAQGGLQESQPQEQPEEAEEEKLEEDEEIHPEQETEPEKTMSEGSQRPGNLPDLSTKELMKHSAYLEAVRGLKQGHIQEHDFLAMFSKKQRQGLFKAMEYRRSPAMAADWNTIDGKGSKKRKIDMLLCFLKDGLQESQLYKETKVEQGWNEKKKIWHGSPGKR